MDERRIFKDLKIRRRDGVIGEFWYCYFLHEGKPVRRSMRTADEDAAVAKAIDLYRRYRDGKVQEVARTVSFETVAQRFLESKEASSDFANKEAAVRRFFVPFFHKERRLPGMHAITQADVDDYIEWRRCFHDDPDAKPRQVAYDRRGKRILARRQRYGAPANNTINRENIGLRQLLAFAVQQRWLPPDKCPKVPLLKAKANRREAITHRDYARLVSMAAKRIEEVTDPRQKHQRTVLLDFLITARHTGLRPGEAFSLTWGDVRLDEKQLDVRHGKTGRRKVPLLDQDVLERLWQIRRRHEQNGEVDTDAPVFADIEGQPTKSVKRSFARLIDACRFEHHAAKDYSLYSLRHLYATHWIALHMPRDLVGRLMGTSEKMLRLHYDHNTVELARAWLDQHPYLKRRIPTEEELWPKQSSHRAESSDRSNLDDRDRHSLLSAADDSIATSRTASARPKTGKPQKVTMRKSLAEYGSDFKPLPPAGSPEWERARNTVDKTVRAHGKEDRGS